MAQGEVKSPVANVENWRGKDNLILSVLCSDSFYLNVLYIYIYISKLISARIEFGWH